MGTFLSAADLTPFAEIESFKAEAMIADAEAMAVLAAPCIKVAGFTNTAALKAILRGAVLRWHDSGSGAFQSQQMGPFGVQYDTRHERRAMFRPEEIVALQNLCSANHGGVYSVSLAGPDPA